MPLSGPRMLVAGTSEYIHAARTRANASVPCRVNTLSLMPAGRNTHAELMSAPFTATVMRLSHGGRSISAICCRTASRMLVGNWTSTRSAMPRVLPERLSQSALVAIVEEVTHRVRSASPRTLWWTP